jgi:hypothetical protein
LQEEAKALAVAARREKEANLTKLLDEFGIQHEDASNLAAAGVRTVEDLIIIDQEELEALSLSLSLSVINKKKLLKLLEHVGSPAFLAAAAKKKREEEAQAAADAAEAGLKRAQEEEEQRLKEREDKTRREEEAAAHRQSEEELRLQEAAKALANRLDPQGTGGDAPKSLASSVYMREHRIKISGALWCLLKEDGA